MRRIIGISILVLLAFLGTTAESLGCSSNGGATNSPSHSVGPKNHDIYKEWCVKVRPGDNETYVYYWTDHHGNAGYVRGRSAAEKYIKDAGISVKRIC